MISLPRLRRLRKNLTYANIASTFAVFVAVSTGGAYAATTLTKNSVRSGHIKDAQVTLADLHPTVRKRLGAPNGSGGGGAKPPTGRPGAWADTGMAPQGAWAACTAACGEGTMGGYHAGPHIEATDIGSIIGAAKSVNLRWTGNLTNAGSKVAHATVFIYTGSKPSLLSSGKGYAAMCATPYAGIAPGQSLDVSQMNCTGRESYGAYRYARSRVDLLADNNTFPDGLTSTLKLEVQPIG